MQLARVGSTNLCGGKKERRRKNPRFHRFLAMATREKFRTYSKRIANSSFRRAKRSSSSAASSRESSKFGRNNFYDAESWDFQRSESFLRSISLTKAKLESVSRSKQSQLHRALKDRVCHSRSGYQWGCLFCIAKDCSFYCSPLPIILLSTREQKEINIRSSKGTRIPIHFWLARLLFSLSLSLSLSLCIVIEKKKKKIKKTRERIENKFFTHLGPRVFLVQRKRNHEIARIRFPLVRLFYGTILAVDRR